jgi:hypothetical protein
MLATIFAIFHISFADVNINGEAVGLQLQHKDTPDTLRETIRVDIQHILTASTRGQIRWEEYDDQEKAEYGVDGYLDIQNDKSDTRWPEVLDDNGFGDYINDEKTGKRNLIVSGDIVSQYKQAQNLQNKYKNIIVELYAFIDKANRGDVSQQLTLDEKREIIWLSARDHQEWPEAYFDNNLADLKKFHIQKPSILEFYDGIVEGSNALICISTTRIFKDNSLGMIGFAYDEKVRHWKFLATGNVVWDKSKTEIKKGTP